MTSEILGEYIPERMIMNKYLKNLDRIEFVVTMACTGRCKHCSEGEHAAAGEHIDGEIGAQVVRQICGAYAIQSLMTFGGEPLLYPEDVCKIHGAARECGIPKRQLITNGFFSRDKERIREVVHRLAESGVNQILLSADAFHQETIPLETVLYFGECVTGEGIPVKLNPAWLVSREHDNPYNIQTREIMKAFADMQIPAAVGNIIFPAGNARKYLGEYFKDGAEYENPYDEDPADLHTISFKPDGSALGGNINRNHILDIIAAYRP